MKRIKVSNNFSLDEFINRTTYERFGAKSQRYIRQELIQIAQTLLISILKYMNYQL